MYYSEIVGRSLSRVIALAGAATPAVRAAAEARAARPRAVRRAVSERMNMSGLPVVDGAPGGVSSKTPPTTAGYIHIASLLPLIQRSFTPL
jgi:hypothetical protein